MEFYLIEPILIMQGRPVKVFFNHLSHFQKTNLEAFMVRLFSWEPPRPLVENPAVLCRESLAPQDIPFRDGR